MKHHAHTAHAEIDRQERTRILSPELAVVHRETANEIAELRRQADQKEVQLWKDLGRDKYDMQVFPITNRRDE